MSVKHCLSHDSRSSVYTILTPRGNETANLRAVIVRYAALPANGYGYRGS